jgi:hypothetical protein
MAGGNGEGIEATVQLNSAAQALAVTFQGQGQGAILGRQEVCRIAGWRQGGEGAPAVSGSTGAINLRGW